MDGVSGRFRNSSTIVPQKERKAKGITHQSVDSFLASGGEIEKIEYGRGVYAARDLDCCKCGCQGDYDTHRKNLVSLGLITKEGLPIVLNAPTFRNEKDDRNQYGN